MASEGAASLALRAAFSGGRWQEAGASVEANADWSAHTTITLDVYAPEDAADISAQVYTITGGQMRESASQHFALAAEQWNTITVPLSLLGDLTDVKRLGVRIGTNIAVFEGTFNIDKVRFGDQPNVVFAFSPVEGTTIEVPNLIPGSYRVEVWDTTNGAILSAETVEAGDGALSITLPTFTTDLALKVKPE